MDFNDIGFEVLQNVLSLDEIQPLILALDSYQLKPLTGGIRRIETLVPEIDKLCHSSKLLEIAQGYLRGQPQFVRAIFFDKTPQNNWFVTWHQDRTIVVSERFELEGWGPWSRKEDAWHVQPPLAVLEDMITLRINLDPSTIENGCLKFIPGSHKFGIIKASQVQERLKASDSVYCEAPSGSAIAMRPHIFHASEKASNPKPRRVLHFEYSSYDLPQGIKWSE